MVATIHGSRNRGRNINCNSQRIMLMEEPMGYVDGMNTYQIVGDNPENCVDPMGLQTTSTQPATQPTWGIGKTTVIFPSGQSFNVVPPQGGDATKYADPHNSGVPLIDSTGREKDKVSNNFSIAEFRCHDGSTLLRLDPKLVDLVQRVRNRVGLPMTIVSGYRSPAYNKGVGGAAMSQHMSGRAADIIVTGKTTIDDRLKLARIILEEGNCVIGIGFGKTIVHIDTRQTLTSFTYPNTEWSEKKWDEWVKCTVAEIKAGRTTTRPAK